MRRAIALGIGILLATSVNNVLACEGDVDAADSEPIQSTWPTLTLRSSTLVDPASSIVTITDPAIVAWKQNTTGAKGNSPDATINAIVSQIAADVQTVAYNSTNVYLRASGVPSHPVGPFPGNPAAPSDRNRTFRIPRSPDCLICGVPTAQPAASVGAPSSSEDLDVALDQALARLGDA